MRFYPLNVNHRGRKALAAGLLLMLFVGALFVTPGIRHQHQGGDASHHHHHSHNGSHSHSHGHGHSHSHGSALHRHGSGNSHSHGNHHDSSHETPDQQSHIHVSFLWFQLTLPDFFASRDTPADSSGPTTESTSLADCEIVTLPTSAAFNQLLLVLVIPGLLLGNGHQRFSRNFTSWKLVANDELNGRLPDEPDTPPPRKKSA